MERRKGKTERERREAGEETTSRGEWSSKCEIWLGRQRRRHAVTFYTSRRHPTGRNGCLGSGTVDFGKNVAWMPHLAAILNNRRSLFQRPLHCARLRCYYDEGGLFAFRDNMWRIVNHPARRQFPAKKVERGRDEQERSDSREHTLP